MKKCLYFMMFLVFIGLASPVYASNLYPVMDRHLVKEAELIFTGRVTAIQYKFSTPSTANEKPIPHTFVTCSVDEVLKGVTPVSNIITLRLMGGASVDEPSKVLSVEGVPEFKLNDYGMFFVRENGKLLCPLIGWQQGFIRIENDIVSTYQGRELMLTGDPLYAARLHPLDIRDYPAVDKELSSSRRLVDGSLLSSLSDEARQIVNDPANRDLVKGFDVTRLTYEYPFRNNNEVDIVQRLFPTHWRAIPRGVGQMLVFRDMGAQLIQRKRFTESALNQLSLRASTKSMLALDQDRLPVEKVMLLNRRILEDAYPKIVTRSLDQTVLTGPAAVLSINPHAPIGGREVKEISQTGISVNGQTNDPDPTPAGTRLTREPYLAHLRTMVKELHTADELRALPAVQSADIQASFQSAIFRPVQR